MRRRPQRETALPHVPLTACCDVQEGLVDLVGRLSSPELPGQRIDTGLIGKIVPDQPQTSE